MVEISINDVTTQISDLLLKTISGEEVIILKDKSPVIRMSPIESK